MTRKILQISHDYKGPFVLVCRQYVDAFPDDEVTTVFLRGEASDRVSESVGGHRVQFLEQGDNLRGFKFSQMYGLYQLIKDDRFDLVIGHRYKGLYLAGMMSYLLPFPAMLGVVHEHGVFKRMTRKLFVTFWRRRFVIAGVSESVTRDVGARCPSLISGQRLFTLPNALPADHEARIFARSAARQTLGLEDNAIVIGTVGRLVKKKALPVLLEGFASADLPDNVRLAIAGDGPLKADLMEMTNSLGIADRVIFLGHVKEAGLKATAFDVFVLPSGAAEAFGLVLLEAMMARVPVICSDAAGPSEVVGETALQFVMDDSNDLARQLKAMLQHSEAARQEMGEQGYARAQQQFSHARFCQKLAELPLFS